MWDHISSYRLSLARLGLARLGLAQIAAARLPRPSLAIGLVRNARLRSALEGLGLAWLSSARFRRACLDSDWRGLAQPGPARIGSGRLGSKQFGDLVNFFSFLFRTDRWREKTLYFMAKHVLLMKIPDVGLRETKVLQIEVLGIVWVCLSLGGFAALARLGSACSGSAWLRSA